MKNTVGQDIASDAYWRNRADNYSAGIEGPYHRHRLAIVSATVDHLELRDSVCIDVGCGEGVFTHFLAVRGAHVLGIDINDTLLGRARARFQESGLAARLIQAGIEHLSGLADMSIDHVFALNVIAYFSPSEERLFYSEAARVVRPGGTLTVTHSNELFDLFTLNRYTVEFFRRHFSVDGKECDVRPLLKSPDRPERTTFSIRENPLSYRHKLAGYGFRELHQEFANFHSLPPLLTPGIDFDDINARTYRDTVGWPEAERWKLAFTCSMFASHATKEAS